MLELSTDGTGLGVEDSGVGAAAVEAEEAGEGQGGVGGRDGLLFDDHDRFWEKIILVRQGDAGRRGTYLSTDMTVKEVNTNLQIRHCHDE